MPRMKKTFGGCTFQGTSPTIATLSPRTQKLSVWMSFEEALKFNLAVQECVSKLNSYHRGTRAGRRMGLNVTVHLQAGRMTINETSV